MQARTLTSIFVLSVAATGLGATPGLTDQGYCRHIGGGVVTNFLQPADCAASFQSLCTDGVATGDLRGSVGVSVLGIAGNVYHVHHHWVTESATRSSLKMPILPPIRVPIPTTASWRTTSKGSILSAEPVALRTQPGICHRALAALT